MPDESPYTLVGSPFSPYTRTIALGLQYKGLKYNHTIEQPHPYPFLIFHDLEGKKADKKMIEVTKEIAWAIEEAEPKLSLSGDPYYDLALQERIWGMIDMVQSFGFSVVTGLVDARIKALDEGVLSEAEMQEKMKKGLRDLERYLDKTESMMITRYPFGFGDDPTWADFFVYPLLADLRMTPEWKLVGERLKK